MTEASSNTAQNVLELFFQAARTYPDRPALELPGATYTYLELLKGAANIAFYITELDDPCPFIAVIADKSFTCYSGILGILMAGKAYLPINPRFPAARNQYMLDKARVKTIIGGENSEPVPSIPNPQYPHFLDVLDDYLSGRRRLNQSPAYLLFTSGTTGKPKGVPVSHENLTAYLYFMRNTYDFNYEDRFTQIFDLTFDLSVHDMFLAWSSGACLCVPEVNSSFAMSRYINDKQPTVWFSVPSVVNLMSRMRLLKPGAFPSIRLSFFCGEALKIKMAQSWKIAAPRSRLINLYGPTEATIAVSRYDLPHEPGLWKSDMGIVSIGRIFSGNSFKIEKISDWNDKGELCLSGKQVVKSYFESDFADLTSFFTESRSRLKYYRTGDLVRVDKDGDLFFIGRKDAEVKISGFRVNLREIENVLEGYESVRQAVVIYEQADDSTGVIMAFILAGAVSDSSMEQALDAYSREFLPWYMVPGKFIFVDDFPLNVNGKVDKTVLIKNYHDGK